jgi:hypothetical protein
MSFMEQTMMDFDRMANEMLSSRFPLRESLLAVPATTDDEDFFNDLPVKARGHQRAEEERQEPSLEEGKRAFSSYSYSSSSVLDDEGRRVASVRRRYEDSTGRMKAMHKKQVGGRVLRTIWDRQSKEEEGKHDTICSEGSPEEFEKMWSQTPFGKAETKKLEEQQQQGNQPLEQQPAQHQKMQQ